MDLQVITTYLQEHMPGKFFLQEAMSKHTSFRIGGPADLLIAPTTEAEVAQVVTKVRNCQLPLTVIGNGSNLLVRDKGIRGVVVKLGNNLKHMQCSGTTLTAEAGVSLAAVSNQAALCSLTGLEFAVGIPGSLGGAVYMNAGAYDGEMKNVVTSVRVMTEQGVFKTITNQDLAFSYRHSILQSTQDIITSVELKLVKGQNELIQEKMADFTNRRLNKQPVNLPSAGSMFKRPPGYYAGALIEGAGLKGYRVGDAQVSEKHAGFVVNMGKATAQDVLQLIKDVQEKVFAASGQHLEPEVKIIGEE